MKSSLSILAISVAFAAGACGEDGGTGPRLPAAATATTVTSQSARMGDTVPAAPAIRVTDSQGNPMAGVPVQFSVGGGGVVATPQTVTAADGTASAGQWRLGTGPPLNTVTSLVSGLPPVTFTADALDPCTLSTVYAVGDVVSGELDALDCRPGTGQRIDYYAVQLTSPGSFLIEMESGGESALSLTDAEGRVIAHDESGARLRIPVLGLPAGTYFVGVGGRSSGPAASRMYTMGTREHSDVAGCDPPWIVPGLSTEQRVTAGDYCGSSGTLGDYFALQLQEGQSITVEQRASSFQPLLALTDAAGTRVATGYGVSESSGAPYQSSAQLRYYATSSGTYLLRAGPIQSYQCHNFGGCTAIVGPYTLTVH